jgi:ATP adenylyltransferase
MEYIKGEKEEGCVFCRILAENDDERNLVIFRGKRAAVMMNIYPYNNGHLMILPFRHVGEPGDLVEEEVLEIHRFSVLAVEVLKRISSPDGFNLGVNLGSAAGAGVKGHYHLHVVPRWNGDTNFMPVISETKVIPQALKDTYRALKEGLSSCPY